MGFLIALLVVGSTVFRGWVLSLVWSWFVVPTFDAPQLSIAIAIGISLLIGMFSRPSPSGSTSTSVKSNSAAQLLFAGLYSILLSSMTLVLGAIVHLFI